MTTGQKGRAQAFHDLHHGRTILVLPNAWDAASARIFELAGARAIGTTSGGIAASLGYPDGEALPRELLVAAVRQITQTVAIPVSVDLEAGYGTTPSEVCDTVEVVLAEGAVGINIEDGTGEPTLLVEKIAAIREHARRGDVPLFINGRTDVFLAAHGDPRAELDEAIRRLHAYERAGADGLFAPGLEDAPTISRLLGEIHRPLNILARRGVPPVAELQRLGVARVSVGSGPMRATLALTRRIAHELLQKGTYTAFVTEALSWAETNRMFTKGGP